jgi:hypothetical protein
MIFRPFGTAVASVAGEAAPPAHEQERTEMMSKIRRFWLAWIEWRLATARLRATAVMAASAQVGEAARATQGRAAPPLAAGNLRTRQAV